MLKLCSRYQLLLLSVIVFCCACRQKSYDELLQENRELKQLISEREKKIENDYYEMYRIIKQGIKDSIEIKLYPNFWDSIFRLWNGQMPYCENKFARINELYSNQYLLHFIEPANDFYEVVFTVPTKDLTVRYKDTIRSVEEKVSFIPAESGIYHWSAELRVNNNRTKQQRIYQIRDSILIMK